MTIIHNFINIPDKMQDLKTIAEYIRITNIGIEAVTQTYDDHTLDKNVATKLFGWQENLIYRLQAVLYHYELLLNGIDTKSSVDLEQDPFEGPFDSHPTIYRYSCELGSIVDSIFFHLSSVFDYLAHYVSYMFEINKDKTLDWKQLAKTSRDSYAGKFKTAEAIQEIHKGVRTKLNDYRSEVIHRKRDLRFMGITKVHGLNKLSLIFSASAGTMKEFKNNVMGYDSQSNYTIDCLPSSMIYQSIRAVNLLLGYNRYDLIKNSKFDENRKSPKNGLEPYLIHPISKQLIAKSDVIWTDYQKQLDHFFDGQKKRRGEWEAELPSRSYSGN